MRALVFLFLFPGLGFAKFGTEIELVGARHRADVACSVAMGVGATAALGGAATAGVMYAFTEAETANPLMIAGLGAGATLACGARFVTAEATNVYYLKKIEDALRARSPAPRIEHVVSNALKQDALQVTYEDGSQILFTQDPNVIEIKMILADVNDAVAKKDFLQREVWDFGRRLGLKAPKRDNIWNGGHIHIDLEDAFGRDPQRVKRFALDFWAHPELQEGLLARDHFNAAPLKLQDPAVRAEVDKFAAAMDRLTAEGKLLDKDELFRFYRDHLELFGPKKSLYFNPKLGTLEIRGLRSQRSGDDLARVIRLIDGQIRYTNALPDRSFAEILAAKGGPARGRAAMTESFARYVERAGFAYEEMKQIVPARFRRGVGACAGYYSWFAGN